MGAETELLPGNDPYCYQIHSQIYLLSHCYIKMRRISQQMDNFILSILLTQQLLENQANQGYTAEVMQ
jgi:hypothetical protein